MKFPRNLNKKSNHQIVSNEILFSQVFSENIWQLNFVEVSQSENFQVTLAILIITFGELF